jgi:cytochrome c553
MRAMRTLIVLAASSMLSVLVGASAGAGALDHPGYAKSLTCSACHGAAGNSKSDSMPIISGLSPAYFKKQMDDYAAGKRPSPEMEPYAKMVIVLGVDDVARFFADQKMEPTPIVSSADAIARGRTAAMQCVICHGPEGKGDAAKLIPSLAGQPPGYLKAQMLLFKEDKRTPGDPTLNAMKALMRLISDETYADLAAYYSSVR